MRAYQDTNSATDWRTQACTLCKKQSHLILRGKSCTTDAPDLPRSTKMTACMYSFTRGGVLRVTLHR
jgi:hypothetical protein